MSEVMTIRVDRKTKNRLEKLAKAMERSKSYVAAEAIRAYVELNEWQITEIRAALKEAGRERLAPVDAQPSDSRAVVRQRRCRCEPVPVGGGTGRRLYGTRHAEI